MTDEQLKELLTALEWGRSACHEAASSLSASEWKKAQMWAKRAKKMGDAIKLVLAQQLRQN